jgi:hypothetical protein
VLGSILPVGLGSLLFSPSLEMSFDKGLLNGLKEGLTSFLALMKGAVNFVFDAKFREEILKRAADLIGPWVQTFSDPTVINKFLSILKTNGRAIGKVVGGEIGAEINDEIVQKSANEICEWVGRLIGLVLFEIILMILTELLGLAAAQGARWIGEGGRIVSRLLPKLKPLIREFEEIKNFLRGRLLLLIRKTFEEFVNLNAKATPEEIELGRFLDKLAQDGLLADFKRLRGVPEVEGVASPDFHIFRRQATNLELRNLSLPADLRGDAVIAEGHNIDNIISGAIGSKAGRQAEAIFIDIGSRGTSGRVIDDAVRAWKVEDVAPMSPSLKRLMVIRNTGGSRAVILDLRIR